MIYSKCGTPGYVAPEIFLIKSENKSDLAKYNTHKCDIFSIGVIFYYM